jgi:hypothetical protein
MYSAMIRTNSRMVFQRQQIVGAQKRDLSSQTTMAIEKLKNAFEEYRKVQ